MREIFRIAQFVMGVLLIALGSAPVVRAQDTTVTEAVAPAPFPDRERVAGLIAQLGKSRYVVRRAAEQELLEIGMPAFDQVDEAAESIDPEIAANCRYLLSQMTVRWTRRDDPPQVAMYLEDYADYDEMYRLQTVQQLANLPEHMGIAPLCRICRYDSSLVVSRAAAVALMDVGQTVESYVEAPAWKLGRFDIEMGPEQAKVMRETLGPSVREGAHWIRLFALQLESPADTIPHWNEAIEKAMRTADAPDAEEALSDQVEQLLWNLTRVHLQLKDERAFLEVADRLVEGRENQLESTVEGLVNWILSAEIPSLVDQVLKKYEPKLSSSRAGLYLMARARADQGQSEEAERLAEAAFKFAPSDVGEETLNTRNFQARSLIAQGRVAWGRREYGDVISKATPGSMPHVVAVVSLADSLHDWQEDEEAANVLQPLTHLLQTDRTARAAYDDLRNDYYYNLPDFTKLLSLQYFYTAAHLSRQEGDKREEQWSNLQKSIKYDREDVDVLIAMYRASEGNEANRKLTMGYIERRCREIEQEIDNNPVNFNSYNEWAWLVGNTEGDLEKAIRYSHQSIKLLDDPESDGGLLDTLARCYYSAGDLESALKYQTEAVEKLPHARSVRRQLEEFQEAGRKQGLKVETPGQE